MRVIQETPLRSAVWVLRVIRLGRSTCHATSGLRFSQSGTNLRDGAGPAVQGYPAHTKTPAPLGPP